MKQRTLRWMYYTWNAAKLTVFFGVSIIFVLSVMLLGVIQLDEIGRAHV